MESMLKVGDILEISGITTMLMTMIDVSQAFWFTCGGLAFLVGAIIKMIEYKERRNDRKNDRNQE